MGGLDKLLIQKQLRQARVEKEKVYNCNHADWSFWDGVVSTLVWMLSDCNSMIKKECGN